MICWFSSFYLQISRVNFLLFLIRALTSYEHVEHLHFYLCLPMYSCIFNSFSYKFTVYFFLFFVWTSKFKLWEIFLINFKRYLSNSFHWSHFFQVYSYMKFFSVVNLNEKDFRLSRLNYLYSTSYSLLITIKFILAFSNKDWFLYK